MARRLASRGPPGAVVLGTQAGRLALAVAMTAGREAACVSSRAPALAAGASWQQWQRSSFVRVRSGVRSPVGLRSTMPLSERQRTDANACHRQAGGHWFERSTAHTKPVLRARQQRLCAPAATCAGVVAEPCPREARSRRDRRLPASKPAPPKVRWRCDEGAAATDYRLRRRRRSDGWAVARIPQVRGAISQGATRRGGARKRDRRAPRAARGSVRGAARAARPHRQRLARADDRGLKSMTG